MVNETLPDDDRRSGGLPLSSALQFALAAVLAVVAVLLYTGRLGGRSAPPPTPGHAQLIDVVNALRAQGLAAEQAPKLFVPRRAFSTPGQGVTVGGAPLFAFVFPDPETARQEFAAADPAQVIPETLPGGVARPPGDPLLVQGSNVVVALLDSDAATQAKVRTAIEGLP
ncbi:MAG: hypothetical protein IT337_13465 [Thermomicrobiales bacterium]|nr:hypothetical protein [Thermomicrobiales bacterium]